VTTPQPGAPRPQPTGVRKTEARIMAFGMLVTVGPGILVFAVLTLLGAPTGVGGIVGLLVIMAAMVGFAGWVFSGSGSGHQGGRRRG